MKGKSGDAPTPLRFELSENGTVLQIILDRPSKRNAISPDMALTIREVLKNRLNTGVRLVLIRSAVHGVFCAGFDIGHMNDDTEDPATPLYDLYDCLEDLPQITMAFTDGLVIGGGVELFLCCDLRLASPRSVFKVPPAKLSLVYQREGIARFMRKIGMAATQEYFLTGRTATARDAENSGLATRILEVNTLAPYIQEVLQGAPLAQQAMKEIIHSIARTPAASEEEESRFELLKRQVLNSEDHREALAAFREKRPPQFKGK